MHAPTQTPLATLERERQQRREELRERARALLRRALSEVLPGTMVYVFGTITQPGRFHDASDVDLAVEQAPVGRSVYLTQALIEERVGRPVDFVVLAECRFREKILAQGERWTG